MCVCFLILVRRRGWIRAHSPHPPSTLIYAPDFIQCEMFNAPFLRGPELLVTVLSDPEKYIVSASFAQKGFLSRSLTPLNPARFIHDFLARIPKLRC